MSKNIAKHYARIIKQWPRDNIRPDASFTKLLAAREAKQGGLTGAKAEAELRNVNALYSLLDNRYTKKYPLPAGLLEPESNPDHYNTLVKDIEEAPSRTVAQSWFNRMKSKIRWG